MLFKCCVLTGISMWENSAAIRATNESTIAIFLDKPQIPLDLCNMLENWVPSWKQKGRAVPVASILGGGNKADINRSRWWLRQSGFERNGSFDITSVLHWYAIYFQISGDRFSSRVLPWSKLTMARWGLLAVAMSRTDRNGARPGQLHRVHQR